MPTGAGTSGNSNVTVTTAIVSPIDPNKTPSGGSDPVLNITPDQCLASVSTTSGASVWVAKSDPSGSERDHTQLFRQDWGNPEFIPVGDVTNWVYNSIAYNSKDGYIYAISQNRPYAGGNNEPAYPMGHLLRISPVDGTIADLGQIDPAVVASIDISSGMTNGTFDLNGDYIFANNSSGGTNAIYKISFGADGKSPQLTASGAYFAVTNVGKVADKPTSANDWATVGFDSTPYVWSLTTTAPNHRGIPTLYRMNTSTGEVKTFEVPNLKTASGVGFQTSGVYGTAWTYGNGNLGFGHNAGGFAYQIKVTNPDSDNPGFELVSVTQAPTQYNNDATSNAYAINELVKKTAELSIKKELITAPDGQVAWRVTVSNDSDCPVTGFTVSDLVPTAAYEPGSVTLKTETSGWDVVNVIPATDKTNVTITHGSLAGGKTASFVLTATPTQSTECVENTASLVSNEKESDLTNNISSDEKCLPRFAVKKETVDSELALARGATTVVTHYTVTVTNTGKVDATSAQVIDVPQTPPGFTIDSVKVDGNPVVAPYVVTAGDQLAVGASKEHVVEVTFKVDQTQITDWASLGTCDAANGAGDPSKGLYNLVTMDGDTDGVENNDACIPVVKDPAFEVVKVADAAAAVQQADGSFDASYAVTVNNTGGVDGTFGKLTDAPRVVPGYTIAEVKVDGTVVTADDNGAYLVSKGEALAKGANKAFKVVVTYTKNADATDQQLADAAKCEPVDGTNPASPTGAYNAVTLVGEDPAKVSDNDACVTIPTPGTPAASIVKKINGQDANNVAVEVPVGSDMVVTFEVTNTGDAPLSPVTVTDNVLPTNMIVPPNQKLKTDGSWAQWDNILLPGEFAVFTATWKAPAAGTQHVNVGTAHVTVPPTTVPATTVPGTTRPEIPVPGTTVPGSTVPGTTDATTTFPGTTVPPITVPPTTVPATTIPGTTKPEIVITSTTLTPTDPATATVTTTPVEPGVPGFSIVKKINGFDADTVDAAAVVAVGSDMNVTFEVTNTGTTVLRGVTVTDDKIAADQIKCDDDNVVDVLMPGALVTCSATFKAPAAAGGSHVNVGTAAVTVPPTTVPGTTDPGTTVPGTTDATTTVPGTTRPGTTVPESTVPATVVTTTNPANAVVPKVEIKKYVKDAAGQWADANDVPAAVAGEKMDFKFVVTNSGQKDLTNVTVTDDKVASGLIQCAPDNTNVVPLVKAGESVDCFATAAVDVPAPGATHVNVGTVAGEVPPTTIPGTTVSESTIPGTTLPGTTVPGTTDATTTVPGTTYPETTVPATTVPGTTNPGTSVPGTTLKTTDPATATVTTTPVEPGVPGFSIVKKINGFDADTVDAAAVVAVGSDMNVTFEVTNTGTTVLRGVTVTDDKIAADQIKCDDDNVVDVLMPGALVTCSATFKAPAAAGGSHVNVGTAAVTVPPTTVPGTTDPGTTVPGTTDATTTVPGTTRPGTTVPESTVPATVVTTTNPANAVVPKVEIKKYVKDAAGQWADANDVPAAVAGEKMDFKFVVTNSGQKDLTNVTVTDDKVASGLIQCAPDNTNVVPLVKAGESVDCFATAAVDVPAPGATHVNVGTVAGEVPPTTIPGTTVSESTIPGTTLPGTTVPGTTDATTTVPGTTYPETTVPATTVPGTTNPGTSVPGTTLKTTDPATATVTTTTEVPAPAVEIKKYVLDASGAWADANDVAAGVAGDAMDFKFTVTNTGGVDLKDVVVTDDKVAAEYIVCNGSTNNVVGELKQKQVVDCFAKQVLKVPAVGETHVNVGTVEVTVPPTTVPGTTVPGSTVPGTTGPSTTVPGSTVPPTTVPGTTVPGTTLKTTDPATATVTTTTEVPAPGTPGIKIIKLINGEDHNEKPGALVKTGELMDVTYKVKNTGDVELHDVKVSDTVFKSEGNEDVQVTCPKTDLAPGEEMTCSAKIMAPEPGVGHYDLGRVEGTPPSDPSNPNPPKVTDEDPEFAHVDSPSSIKIVKKINGDDANSTPGVIVNPGEPMDVTFEVTNTGATTLTNVVVTDDKVPADKIRCENGDGNKVAELAPGASFTCSATIPAPAAGEQHTNTAKVVGTPPPSGGVFPTPTPTPGTTVPGTTIPGTTVPGTTIPGTTNATTTVPGTTVPGTTVPETTIPETTVPGEPSVTTTPQVPENPPVVEDHDPANAVVPGISVVKKINGDDANTAPGVAVAPDHDMTIEFVVTNTGLTKLVDVQVTDKALNADTVAAENITCPKTELAVGETMTCVAKVKAPGSDKVHSDLATVEGSPRNPDGSTPKDKDGKEIEKVTSEDPAHAHSKPGIPPWVPLIPLIPLIPGVIGSSDRPGSSGNNPPAPVVTTPPAPQDRVLRIQDTPKNDVQGLQKAPRKGGTLAKTGASVIGLSLVAGLILLLGFVLVRRRKDGEA
ncbi:DUF7507 domain-containing protein [Corynebacterium epidermidicanis]